MLNEEFTIETRDHYYYIFSKFTKKCTKISFAMLRNIDSFPTHVKYHSHFQKRDIEVPCDHPLNMSIYIFNQVYNIENYKDRNIHRVGDVISYIYNDKHTWQNKQL